MPGPDASFEEFSEERILAENIGANDTVRVPDEWVRRQGLDLPAEDMRWVYATVEQTSGGKKHWLRVVHTKPGGGPAWPVIDRADPVKINVRPLQPLKLDGWKRAFIFPDIQVGYRQLRNAKDELYLDPFHDEVALSVAMAVLKAARPDIVVFLGDCLDFPMLGKFIQEQSFQTTMKDALNRFHRLLALVRALLPHARIVVLEGNHDLRLPKAILTNAMWAFGLTRANAPQDWPVLSLPHLCWFDDLNIEYASGYPANTFWINQNLACIHGFLTGNKTKSAASRVVEDERVSTIFGHVHSIELRQKTRQVYQGQRTNFAASPGCLCRIDGAVPSVKGGIDLWGRPLLSFENWQQGAAIVTFEPDGDRHNYEQLSIFGGTAIWRDRMFDARGAA